MYRLLSETLPSDGLEQYDRESARVMTAMTFDTAGEPIDYFKQVFTAFDISKHLAKEGRNNDVQLLVADDAVMLNQPDTDGAADRELLEQCAAARRDTLAALAEIYAPDLNVRVQFTSELLDKNHKLIVERLGDLVETDQTLRKLLLLSVPKHRRNPAASARENTEYTRRELAAIIRSGADIKVGPRRERFYDAAARDSSVLETAPGSPPRVIGAYVTDTYPTNVSSTKLTHLRKEVEILPYKADAPDLDPEQNRILLRDSGPEIESKVQQAPPELRDDIEALVAYMNDWGPEFSYPLAESLEKHLATIRDAVEFDSEFDGPSSQPTAET